jgi:integrase
MGGRLTAKEIEAACHPKTHARPVRIHDGDGLYLQIAAGGTKSWLLRYTLAGKAREMGLGAFGKPARKGEPQVGVPLADARDKAAEARAALRQGLDPINNRQTQQRREAADRQRSQASTFRALAEEMVQSREAEWKNAKHIQQWKNTLATYAYPVIGDLPVAEILTDDVLRVLKPIWHAKPETASRLRGRIERVLAYAKVRNMRTGDNPAAWRGHLAESLPSPRRVQGKMPGHHPALPWRRIGDFMALLGAEPSSSSRALEFLILTAARTNEVLGARWREVDWDEKAWTVPADRMKAKKEHRVALSQPALAILSAMKPLSTGPGSFIFPGRGASTCLSQMALLMLLRRMNEVPEGGTIPWADAATSEPITAHGFRSTFRDWCGEASSYPTNLAEAALAHALRDKTEKAYARGDLFEKRRELMEAWGAFCITAAARKTATSIGQGEAA